LIEWLTKLEEDETIDYLKLLKDSKVSQDDCWHYLKEEQKAGINRGLKDIDLGRVTLHEEVIQKYGL